MNDRPDKRREVNCSAVAFAACLEAIDPKDFRETITGVRIERARDGKGVLLIGTNGHQLVVIRDTHERSFVNGPDTTWILPPNEVAGSKIRQKPANRACLYEHTLEVDDKFGACIGSAEVKPYIPKDPVTQRDYPAWRNVLPALHHKHKGDGTALIGARIVETVAKIAKRLDAEKMGFMLTHPNGSAGVQLQPKAPHLDAFVVFMPLHGSLPERKLPNWLKEIRRESNDY